MPLKFLVEEDRSGSRLSYADQEEMERSKEGWNGRRSIGGRRTMERSGVRGKGGRRI